MKISLQLRLILSFLPILVLIGVLGISGRFLLDRLGNASDKILRENYDSVVAMVGLNEALERIDSSFQFGVHNRQDAQKIYESQWPRYEGHLNDERRNITILPKERELVARLDELTPLYRAEGDRFFTLTDLEERNQAYYGAPNRPGLLARFEQIKKVTGEIRELNQDQMKKASQNASETARKSRVWFTAGMIGAALLAALLAWRTARSVARPVRELKKAAAAIGAGNLNQSVPILSHDELGELAETFNLMARQLRDFRQSNQSRFLRAQQTSQATIDSFPDPVLVIDLEGRVEMANPAARRVLGVSSEGKRETSGLPWIPPEPLQQPLREAIEHQHAYSSLTFDQAVTFRIGNDECIFLPHILPIRDPYGTMLGAAVVLNDVTRFRLMDQFKSDLVATASHELKTPLTSVRLAIHVLLEETIGPLNPKQTELLVDARENLERLLSLIEHLLSLAQLENSKDSIRLEPVDPLVLLQQAAETARVRAEDKRIEIAIEGDTALPPIAVDPQRISVALGNLLDNALTYTPAGGKITLTAQRAGDADVAITVADTGVGIAAEHLPHVFEKFFRVPGQTEGAGTGLGLAIVKEIVTAHRGQASVERRPIKGMAFRMTLPAWSPN
jgi:two-component system, NtrC family, sensor histidine kinase KinB